MNKLFRKALVVLAVFAIMIPVSVWAEDGQRAAGKTREIPQWVVDACAGKNAGDNVSVTTPSGKTIPAVCTEINGKLVAKSEHKDFRRGGKGHGFGGLHGRSGRGAGRGPGMTGAGFGDNNCFLSSELNLTPEQKTQIKAIMKDEFQKNEKLREQIKENREAFREAVLKTPYDEAAVRKIAEERAKIHTELMVSWGSAINKATALLTPEQKEKAAKIEFGPGMGHGFGWGHGHGWGKGHWGGGPRDGRGPNPDCPMKK